MTAVILPTIIKIWDRSSVYNMSPHTHLHSFGLLKVWLSILAKETNTCNAPFNLIQFYHVYSAATRVS